MSRSGPQKITSIEATESSLSFKISGFKISKISKIQDLLTLAVTMSVSLALCNHKVAAIPFQIASTAARQRYTTGRKPFGSSHAHVHRRSIASPGPFTSSSRGLQMVASASKSVLVPIANGSEEIEAVTIIDTLRRYKPGCALQDSRHSPRISIYFEDRESSLEQCGRVQVLQFLHAGQELKSQ